MTNQEKFIQVFGIDAWQQMIVFSGLAKQFKEYWTSPYKALEQQSTFDKIRAEIDKAYAYFERGNSMSKEKQLIDELSKMPPTVIETAYLYAKNYVKYGEDVTEKWITATQNAMALEKAYIEGYYDALHKLAESERPVNYEPKE